MDLSADAKERKDQVISKMWEQLDTLTADDESDEDKPSEEHSKMANMTTLPKNEDGGQAKVLMLLVGRDLVGKTMPKMVKIWRCIDCETAEEPQPEYLFWNCAAHRNHMHCSQKNMAYRNRCRNKPFTGRHHRTAAWEDVEGQTPHGYEYHPTKDTNGKRTKRKKSRGRQGRKDEQLVEEEDENGLKLRDEELRTEQVELRTIPADVQENETLGGYGPLTKSIRELEKDTEKSKETLDSLITEANMEQMKVVRYEEARARLLEEKTRLEVVSELGTLMLEYAVSKKSEPLPLFAKMRRCYDVHAIGGADDDDDDNECEGSSKENHQPCMNAELRQIEEEGDASGYEKQEEKLPIENPHADLIELGIEMTTPRKKMRLDDN